MRPQQQHVVNPVHLQLLNPTVPLLLVRPPLPLKMMRVEPTIIKTTETNQ